jgi:excinuclease ABC subunit C
LFLIDGGKGQLGSAATARDDALIARPMIGLAKQYEQLVIHKSKSGVVVEGLDARAKKLHGTLEYSDDFILVNLPDSSHLIKLLQRIRDESHRFAVSYHTVLKTSRQRSSWLTDVPSIGDATKKKLIRQFGSARGVLQARDAELIACVGVAKATILKSYIRAEKKSSED